MTQSLPIQQLPENTRGKDYVIGDLHGCYSLLERLLTAVNFDTSQDRLFSVGDIIDRGPDSLRCLELLKEPWFFAVQGNHELMMLDYFWPYIQQGELANLDQLNNNGFLDYGGAWVEKYFNPAELSMTEEFDRGMMRALHLPLLLVVGEGQNRFNIIHAELIRPDYQWAKREVWLDIEIDSWIGQKTLRHDIEERLLWSRTLMTTLATKKKTARVQPGLSMTFCGHTYGHKLKQVLSHICLDTGAFMSRESHDSDYGLTLFDVQESRWLLASYQYAQVITKNLSP